MLTNTIRAGIGFNKIGPLGGRQIRTDQVELRFVAFGCRSVADQDHEQQIVVRQPAAQAQRRRRRTLSRVAREASPLSCSASTKT